MCDFFELAANNKGNMLLAIIPCKQNNQPYSFQ